MVVHPAYANPNGTLANAIAGYFTKSGIKLFRRIGLVHRLDKDVSGLILVAKHENALRVLSGQFSGEGVESGLPDAPRKAEKVYWAVVGPVDAHRLKEAGLGADDGEKMIEGYIWRSPGDRRKSIFASGRGAEVPPEVKARYALSYMSHEKSLGGGLHLIRVRIVTGRTHQIRAQLASLDLPIHGDVLYGGEPRDREGIGLRCVRISIIPIRVYEGLLERGNSDLVPVEGQVGEGAGNDVADDELERIVFERFEVP
jgi:23S rRNA pseudouridine1911/1915/1917 synthase